MNNKQLDRMIEDLKRKNTPDMKKFDLKTDFKARFYQKIERHSVSSRQQLKFYLATAAMACIAVSLIAVTMNLFRPAAELNGKAVEVASVEMTPAVAGDIPETGKLVQSNTDPIPIPEAAVDLPSAVAGDIPETGKLVQRDPEPEPIPKAAAAVPPADAVVSAPPESYWADERVVNTPPVAAAPRLAKKMFAPRPDRATESQVSVIPPDFNTEEYKGFTENPFVNVKDAPLSTFGADVDNGSYVNVRRYLLQQNALPPRDAVRVEEFVNFFTYDYPQPEAGKKFSVTFESAKAPWNPAHKLVLIGVQAAEMPMENLPPANYVFLVDNSGSMMEEMDKVKAALIAMINEMRPQDRLSLVTYGGGVKVWIDGISGSDKAQAIQQAQALHCGGYTPGGEGIQTAYKLAHKYFIPNGNNRIVLVSDGDFNVGVSSESELVKMVEKERSSLIYLSVFGMGEGNYHENKLKMLANKGNGNYYYIDNLREASRIMQACFAGRMFAIARDAKFQVEFNPAQVQSYRLLGYEMRTMAARDFNDDTKDGGEIGVGHQVTVLYEIVPVGAPSGAADGGKVDELKYQRRTVGDSGDILTCKLRYQDPQSKAPSVLESFVLSAYPQAGNNLRWASAAAEFALLLRNSQYKGNADYTNLRIRAQIALGKDADGKRAEFLTMVFRAMELSK